MILRILLLLLGLLIVSLFFGPYALWGFPLVLFLVLAYEVVKILRKLRRHK